MSSATERPSRAPSTTKSVMRAMASGWLSLTPRSSRRRATIAAMAIKSLSFSRGVRFMGLPPSCFNSPANFAPLSGPQPWLASAQRDNGPDKAHAQLVERRGEKAGDNQSVEGARAALDARAVAFERCPQIGQAGLDIGRRGDDRRQSPGARSDGLALESRAGVVDSCLVGEHEPAVAAHAPRVPHTRVDSGLAHREAPEHQRFR